MANYGYNMTQARLIVAIPRRFPKLLQMNESSGVDDMSGLSDLLNIDFTMGKRTAGGENLGQIWPQTQ